MRVALVTVYSHAECTLKDVAGGYGTVFRIGSSLPARLLARAKTQVAELPPVTAGHLAQAARAAGHVVRVCTVRRIPARSDAWPPRAAIHDAVPADVDLALVQTSIVDATAERAVLRELTARGIRTIAYGAYATARPQLFADVADVVVRGEPEALGSAIFDPSLRGTVDAGWVRDLDALPFPEWSDFPIAQYRYAFLTRGTTLPVAGARGCAFGCGYCPWRATAPFRERDPERIVAEVRALIARHGARAIAFRDPLFNLDADRVRTLARGLRPLGVRFSAEMRADRLDPALLETLRDAGLRSLEIGVESVDRAMLAREHRKPPEHAQIERVVRAAHALGVRVVANFMLGLPDDTEESFRASVAWAKRLDTFAVQFTVATPYPGTTLEDHARPRLRLASPESHTGWEPTFAHEHLTDERIRALREWAYLSYHYRPRYALRVARTALTALADRPHSARKAAIFGAHR
jgi:radical SAM superfamily enzyme YgiQ (UPF0313 family)